MKKSCLIFIFLIANSAIAANEIRCSATCSNPRLAGSTKTIDCTYKQSTVYPMNQGQCEKNCQNDCIKSWYRGIKKSRVKP